MAEHRLMRVVRARHSIIATLPCFVLLGACSQTVVVRQGSEQVRTTARLYNGSIDEVRQQVLDRFGTVGNLPGPFNRMRATPLGPPTYTPDWILGFVDPGGFLADYTRRVADRSRDVLVGDATADFYWVSEYGQSSGPAQFRCDFILHFDAASPVTTQVEVHELAPRVRVGDRWGFSAHGVGFGRVRDIRFVEPTVKDRIAMLDLVQRLLASTQ